MKKKLSRSKARQSPVPQSAQLDAVRKLSRLGRHEEAQMRVAALRARFPDFKPLLAREIAAARPDMPAMLRLDDALHTLNEQFG